MFKPANSEKTDTRTHRQRWNHRTPHKAGVQNIQNKWVTEKNANFRFLPTYQWKISTLERFGNNLKFWMLWQFSKKSCCHCLLNLWRQKFHFFFQFQYYILSKTLLLSDRSHQLTTFPSWLQVWHNEPEIVELIYQTTWYSARFWRPFIRKGLNTSTYFMKFCPTPKMR